MARKKATVPDIPKAPPEPPVQPIPQQTKPVIKVRMRGFLSPIHHPDQNRWIPNDVDGVELFLDNWVKSQIKAKLIEEV